MADEANSENKEIGELVIDSDDKMFAYAMESLNGAIKEAEGAAEEEEKNDSADENKQEDQSEIKEEEKKEETMVAKEEPQAKEPVEEKKAEVDTVKPDAKKPYTAEEIEAIAKTGDFSKFDVSRLTPGEQAAMRSMQAGFTPKLQEAAELRKERDTLAQRIRAEEAAKAKAEAERMYQEEKEQYGEDMANLFKKVRDLESAREADKVERERERQAFLDEQQKLAEQQFHYAFSERCGSYGIPNTPQWEEMVATRVVAENFARSKRNEPFISLEDGMRMISDTIGLSDAQRLEELINANPKLKEAFASKFRQDAEKPKAVPPTVPKSSSSGGSSKADVKRSAAPHDKLLDKDPSEWMVQEALAMSKNTNQ